ncbi:MAG: phytanoyl-CoA dioxygenase family protein [Candidatus Puniceispirillales bacterium]
MLTQDQINFFNENGYLVVEDAVTPEQLQSLRDDFAAWVEESRSHDEAWGETVNGKSRFDVETGHSAETPALRRINAPHEVSDAYFEVMADSGMTDMVADLIGPDVKLHHTKINSKLPGSATAVKWHQDFPFTPHTNDSLITALLMVDDVTQENGPLEVWPATHDGTIHTLWHDGQFTGAVSDEVTAEALEKRIICTGKAGSVCLMHTRLLHGSAPNNSAAARTLYICVYAAADAVPLTPSPVPTKDQGLVVRGEDHGRVRAVNYDIPLPQLPKGASFFDQQKSG